MEALGIDIKIIAAQIINFALFIILFKKFLAGPFFKFLDNQQKAEEERRRILQDLEKREAQMRQTREKMLKDAQKESREIISQSKQTAAQTRENMIKKAEAEILEIREKSAGQMQEERKKMYREIQDHMLQTSALIAKNALSQIIDEKEQQKIVSFILKNSDPKKLYEN